MSGGVIMRIVRKKCATVELGYNAHGYNDHGYKDHGYSDHGYSDHGYNDHGCNDHGYNDHGYNKLTGITNKNGRTRDVRYNRVWLYFCIVINDSN